jgi:hypothetical protein
MLAPVTRAVGLRRRQSTGAVRFAVGRIQTNGL